MRGALRKRNEQVSGGKVVTSGGNGETHAENVGAFILDIDQGVWQRKR